MRAGNEVREVERSMSVTRDVGVVRHLMVSGAPGVPGVPACASLSSPARAEELSSRPRIVHGIRRNFSRTTTQRRGSHPHRQPSRWYAPNSCLASQLRAPGGRRNVLIRVLHRLLRCARALLAATKGETSGLITPSDDLIVTVAVMRWWHLDNEGRAAADARCECMAFLRVVCGSTYCMACELHTDC